MNGGELLPSGGRGGSAAEFHSASDDCRPKSLCDFCGAAPTCRKVKTKISGEENEV